MQGQISRARTDSGFSLLELMIAMAVTLSILVMASQLILGALRVRSRENQRSEALADAQRALYTMSREIANSGFGLADNGLVAADSGLSSIRVRGNFNAMEGQLTSSSTSDDSEDVEYTLYSNGTDSYVVRLDVNTGARTKILANRVDSLKIHYYSDKVSYTSGDCDINPSGGASDVTLKSDAKYVVLTVCVQLPAQGTPGSTGYQPRSQLQLTSDVTLRNADLANY
ncbi:MAG: prepilin-type N-terminal cleavage/methylation domain-containing protein [Acidobacteriota bacterium]|nr:prepilin-type N-terminal cleavage/methylation domain-containing protein [Acidobacteriota bacterium]MDQ5837966.1 prepilin-type N-terminal cleavage/methylation domain-containing protein [Acidobacteriota bacterium]